MSWLEDLRASPAKAGGREATDEEVELFAAEHTSSEQPWHLTKYTLHKVRHVNGDGTRNPTRDALCEAARDAMVGWYSWPDAVTEIETAAREAYAERGGLFSENEFARLVKYAVGKANAEDMAELEARYAKRLADELQAQEAVGGWAPELIDDEPATNERPSWAPVDIKSARDSRSVVQPTILRRSDGACLFYRGKVHSVHGETESGKSWLVQCATAECLLAGEPVLYIDFEDEAAEVTARLILLGVPEKIVENPDMFAYVQPETAPRSERERKAFEDLLSRRYSLDVIDGVTDAMGLYGLTGKDNDDVAKWMRLLPKPLARYTGAAVACVDHVAKDPNRGRFALGGQHKMAGLSGAAYIVEMEQPFAIGQCGVASVRVGKDRPGRVRGLGGRWRKSDRTQHIANLLLDSTDAERSVWTLERPAHAGVSTDVDVEESKAQSKKQFRPTWFMEQISRYWEETDDPEGRTNNKTIKGMCEERKAQGKTQHRQYWRDAIKLLEEEQYARSDPGTRESLIYTVLKPYRQIEDPLSDEYSETAAEDVENWKPKLHIADDPEETS